MKNRRFRHFCVALVILACAAECNANNNLFLPGDAYFPTVLTKDDVAALIAAKSGQRTFAYSSLGGYAGAFCGYAGYLNARIPAVDDAFATNLATVYERIREFDERKLVERISDGKTEMIETNGIRVLFYPSNFDFPKHRLGLRYNENWVAEAVKFGHRREDLRLCCLVSDPEAVAISWRDAEAVLPLRAKLPDVELKPVPATETPIIVQGKVKAIVIGSHTLNELFQCRRNDNLTIYIIDSDGIQQLVHEDGNWMPETSK